MKSSVLIVNHPQPKSVQFGADFITDTATGDDFDYPVIAFHSESEKSLKNFLERWAKLPPKTQVIFSLQSVNIKSIKEICKINPQQTFYADFLKPEFDLVVQKALTRYLESHQNEDFMNLAKDENEKLINLSKELEDEVEKREKNLIRAQKRIVNISTQIEALHKALLAVHTAQSVAEVETMLFTVLSKTLDLSWVRVFLYTSDHLESQLGRIQGQTLFNSQLSVGSQQLGRIVFARQTAKAFSKSEEESLHQISESVALAIDRLGKYDQAETLKLQWDSTFDAISEPLCLTDDRFNIVRTNKAFTDTTQIKAEKLLGSNCFSAFCGPSAPSELTPSPTAITLQRKNKSNKSYSTYEVFTQRIRTRHDAVPIVLVMFRDVSEQKKIEKQIFESSKMAELGTIGSSIAHDINNPLGGLLSFLQLIKMDMPAEHPMRDDILQMEDASLRCKEIVESLLKFARRQDSSEAEPIDLKEAVEQALKITSLQTRSLGIKVEVNSAKNSKKILGHFNLLSQALSHVLQNAFDAVSEKLTQTPGYLGQIKVDISEHDSGLTVSIFDNGVGISPELQNKILNPLFSTKRRGENQGLGLTLAYQIINDHQGRLDISSRPNVGTTVKISFSNV
jgi:two-component system, NtrC family, sensor kinase